MKRVLFLLNRFPVTSQTFVLDQVLALENNCDFHVRVVSLSRPPIVALSDRYASSEACRSQQVLWHPKGGRLWRGVQIVSGGLGYALRHPLWFFRNIAHPDFRSLLAPFVYSRIVNTIDADEIIVHFGDFGVLVDQLRQSNKVTGRLNVFFHGAELSRYRTWDRYRREYAKLSHTDQCRILPVSVFWRDKLEQAGCQTESLRVHRMGVSLQRYCFSEHRPFNSTPVFVSVARLVEKKGIDIAIRALATLKLNGLEFRYRVVGAGPMLGRLKRLRDQLGLSEHVEFLGALRPDQVDSELCAADVFLLPSLTGSDGDMEGIPVSLMEAMAAGVPVVSTFHSGIPELIDHEISGLLAQENDPQDLAVVLRRSIEMNEAGWEPLRIAARRRIESEFCAIRWNEELVAMLAGG